MKQRLATFFALVTLPLVAVAQESAGSLTVEQISPNAMLGEWTLIKPGNNRVELSKQLHTFDELPAGSYTLLITPPSGSITTVHKLLEQDLIETKDHPQITFTIEGGMEMTLRIEYTFTRVGIVAVSSDPNGLDFTIQGPNDFKETGTTPASYEDMPEGLYSVQFTAIEDCAAPPPSSDKLVNGSRINFTIKISCENLQNTQQQQNKNLTFEFVNTVIDGQTIIFRDTPIDQWYAAYVHTALKTEVMSGYKAANGTLTGEFGPGNNVTLAELLKIAHKLADIDEFAFSGRALNERARGTWFERYLVSAESQYWLVYQDSRIDLGRNATRAEVVVTLLQALRVPRLWADGELFTDVQRDTEYASSIETAALDGLVDGYDDGSFKPNNPINRAEISKIISNAITLYIEE